MNYGIDISYEEGVFIVSIYEKNMYPFESKEINIIERFTAKDEIELHTILLREGYYDKLKDNE